MTAASPTADREIRVTRVIDAPRARVFDAFTDLRHISAWWGPDGFTTTTSEMDVRPGGIWRFVMHGPDGTDYPNIITYTEVRRPELLRYMHSDDIDTPEAMTFEAFVTFEERDGKTEVTLLLIVESADVRRELIEQGGALEGGKQTLARLAAFIETPAGGR